MHITRRRLGLGILAAAVVTCVAAVLPAVAQASSAGHQAASAPQCKAQDTYVWLALAQNGAAGTLYYPVEFTNVGSQACWLYGYPGVAAVNTSQHQVGPAASRVGATPHKVTLKRDQTAHALLGITEADIIGGCHVKTISGLGAGIQVYPPNQKQRQIVPDFAFQACTNKVYLHVYPVTPGIGVP
jgi:hypothetical protein